MRLARDYARVKVPATTANLGPGFDSMGMALDVWDEVSVRLTTGASHVTILGEGHKTLPKDESHLIIASMRYTFEKLGLPAAGIELISRNEIPQGKGLGSSAAAIVAAIMLVRGLVDAPSILTNEVALDIATEIEGHPDNVAPAIYGGATLSLMTETSIMTAQLPVHESIHISVLVPDEILPTTTARAMLPTQVPHADAVFNSSRAAMLAHALEHRPDLLFAATEDRLHQDYRADSMPRSAELLGKLRKAGWPAVVSGAGPSLLVFAKIPPVLAQGLAASGFRVIDSKQVSGARIID